MKKYDFLLDTIPISVYVLSEELKEEGQIADTLSDDGYAVMIYPTRSADFGVTCVDKNNLELREPYLPLTALSCFFKDVRRFPDITLDVLFCGKVYEVPINCEEKKFTVNVGKCKFICAKTVKFEDETEISVDVVEKDGVCISTLCHDSDLFDRGALLRLPTLLGMYSRTTALAVSNDGKIRISCVGSLPFYDAVALAYLTLKKRGVGLEDGLHTACVNGSQHTFFALSGALTFYPNIKYLY